MLCMGLKFFRLPNLNTLKPNSRQKKVFLSSVAVPAMHGSTACFCLEDWRKLVLTRSSTPPVGVPTQRSSCGLLLMSSCPEQVYGHDDIRNSPPQGSRSHRNRSCAGRISGLDTFIAILKSPRPVVSKL